MSGYPYIFQDLVDAGILRPVQPSASSGWTKYKTGREFSPGIVPGAVLDLHAERANGGTSPGVNSPPTTTWYDLSGLGNHGTLVGWTYLDGDRWDGAGSEADPYCLECAGVNTQRVECASGAPGLGDFSIDTWAWVDNVADNYGLLLGRSPNGPEGWGLYCNQSQTYAFIVTTSYTDGVRASINTTNVFTGGWHHFGGSFDRDGYLRVFYDGVYVTQADISSKAALNLTLNPWLFSYGWTFQGKLAVAREYNRVLSDAEFAQNYAAGPEWDKRTASSVTVPLALGNTAWTVAGRYSGRWAHNDSLAHNLLTLYSGENARATIYKHSDNKLYASMKDGTDTAVSASAAQTLAADTVNTFVARATWGSTVDLSINGVPSTQGNASLVGAQNIDSLVIDGGPSGSIGPLILSPTNKGANWQAAVEAAGFSDPLRLVRDYMAVGDYIVPFGYSSTAYRKVR